MSLWPCPQRSPPDLGTWGQEASQETAWFNSWVREVTPFHRRTGDVSRRVIRFSSPRIGTSHGPAGPDNLKSAGLALVGLFDSGYSETVFSDFGRHRRPSGRSLTVPSWCHPTAPISVIWGVCCGPRQATLFHTQPVLAVGPHFHSACGPASTPPRYRPCSRTASSAAS